MSPHSHNIPAEKNGRVLLDADACPCLQDIIDLSEKHHREVILVSNYCHEFPDHDNVRRIIVDKAPDAADLAIFNEARTKDIAITQDYGLAAMLVGKIKAVLSPRGKIFKSSKIGEMLDQRHLARKERRKGRLRGGPKSYTEKDRSRLLSNLEKIMESQEGE